MNTPGTGQDSPWSYSAGVLGLTGDAFILLRDLVVERTGVYFDDSKRDMFADKMAELVVERGLSSFLDYYYLLRYDADAERHWLELRNRLAVPETYFWRQPEQIETLVQHLVPAHFRQPGARPFRIWSAACCSGEEPLSIAMALQEAGWLGRVPIQIVGSDASPALLERARRGIFRERAFRSLPAALRDRYFTAQGDAWRIDPALQAHVEWRTANLVETDEISALASSDVIFCRNVFIYFSDDAIRRVSGLFYERMPVPGHLFLGAPESLARLGSPFELREIGSAFVYVKEASAGTATEPPIRLEPGSWRRPAGLRQGTS
ncbi:MAG TPA: protein-glutamate O-methyltransferase CheR [Longimicrobiales bacterium]